MSTMTSPAFLRWCQWSQPAVFVLAGLITTFGFTTLVNAEGGNVRYSYEEVRVADESGYALIPHAEGDLGGEVTRSTLEQAFEALRSAKSQTYGNSYAAVSGNVPGDAVVEVHIDSNHAQFAPVIKAEAVYTLTEFGVEEVHFPDHTEEPLTRSDIGVPAYTLTVPLWRVVPSPQVSSAQVLMPDDELVSVQQVERRWDDDREALVGEVYEFLDAEEPFLVRDVVGVLPELGDLRLEEVTPLLVHDSRLVREATLGVLEGYEDDTTALEAVSEALQEESNEELARQMAEFLGRSDDDHFNVEHQFYLLEEGDDEEAEQAVRELSGWEDDERVVSTLLEALVDQREEVAEAAAGSLDELQVHAERIEALDNEDIEADLRLRIAGDLADEANPEQVRLDGYTHTAVHRQGGHANQAIRAIAELPSDDARQQVEEFLDDDTRDRRRTAIDALTDRNDAESVEALMEAAEAGEDAQQMRQAAYSIMVSQPLDEIIDQTRADSLHVQQVAYRAIGEQAAEQGASTAAVDTIEQGADHHDATIRAASAESLGQIGTDDALQTLRQLVDDSDPQVRRQVALAAGEFSDDPLADELLEYLDDDDPGVVAAAIDTMERRDDRRAEDRIEQMVDDDAPQVRASALRAVTTFLPSHEDEDIVRSHMGLLSGSVSDDAPEVQKSALEQLGRFNSSMAVTNIATLVGADDPDLRVAAVEALEATGHDDARPLLESALNDEDAEVRRQAIESLTELIGSEARAELEARMEEEEDPEVREFLEAQLQQI